jgi:4-amino-4-deoxy-L-arabinose transferase-like glycosyltransferase
VSLLGLAALAAATYLVGRLYVSRPVGLWAAGLISLAWLSLYAGHLARPDIVAAAAVTATIGLLHWAMARRQWALYFALGLALIWQMDLHLNAVHFVLPLTLLAFFQSYRDRSWRLSLALGMGLLFGGAAFAVLHLGNVFERFTAGVGSDPSGLLASYTDFSGQNLVAATAAATANFWWKYYVWFASFFSLPQAALFLFGLLYALAGRQRNLLTLAFITLLSTLTFGVVNQQYQLPGYALLWLPLYLIMGVAGLDGLARKFNRPAWAAVVLAGLMTLYAVGDVRLARTPLGAIYQTEARTLLTDVPAGARVLSKSFWWYAMQERVEFIDDDIIATFGKNIWDPTAVQGEANEILGDNALFAEQLTALKLEYVITDQIIGCNAGRTPLSDQLSSYLSRSCYLHRTYPSSVYGPQSVYRCQP